MFTVLILCFSFFDLLRAQVSRRHLEFQHSFVVTTGTDIFGDFIPLPDARVLLLYEDHDHPGGWAVQDTFEVDSSGRGTMITDRFAFRFRALCKGYIFDQVSGEELLGDSSRFPPLIVIEPRTMKVNVVPVEFPENPFTDEEAANNWMFKVREQVDRFNGQVDRTIRNMVEDLSEELAEDFLQNYDAKLSENRDSFWRLNYRIVLAKDLQIYLYGEEE
jgi:hypothetical protein